MTRPYSTASIGVSHFLMMSLYWSLTGTDDAIAHVEAELFRAQAIESYDTAAIRLIMDAGVEWSCCSSPPIVAGPPWIRFWCSKAAKDTLSGPWNRAP